MQYIRIFYLKNQLLAQIKHVYIWCSLLHVSSVDGHHQTVTTKTRILKPNEAIASVSIW